MSMRAVLLALCLAVVLAVNAAEAATQVAVEGLLPGSAVLNIDGERKLLRVGRSHRGVTLLQVDGDSATLDIDGRREQLGLSQRIQSRYQPPARDEVSIVRNGDMQYLTPARINGQAVRVMVDTGANTVAMSMAQAGRLGLDHRSGMKTSVQTASGVATAYRVLLRSVSVGDIRVDNVPAAVVEGEYPATILLGMSYLRHVSMREEQGTLLLSRQR